MPGSFQQPLDGDIFKAPTGEIQGPVATSTGNFVFEVISATPEKVLGLNDTAPASTGTSAGKVSDQIKTQIKSQLQQEALSNFGTDFRDYWTNLTQCASGYEVSGCDNFNGASPTCDPKKLAPHSRGNPARVARPPSFAFCQPAQSTQGASSTSGQLQCTGSGPTPGAPGSFKPFTTSTGGAPQGPHPAGAGTRPRGRCPQASPVSPRRLAAGPSHSHAAVSRRPQAPRRGHPAPAP